MGTSVTSQTVIAPMPRRYKPRRPRPNTKLTPAECNAYRARIFAIGQTQEWAALKIGKQPGPFSRWIRGEFASAPNRKKLDALLAREEAKRGLSAHHHPVIGREQAALLGAARRRA